MIPGGNSFTAGTLVLLASGKAEPISVLKTGDKVVANDTKTGRDQPEAVTAVLVHHDNNLYNLTVKTSRGTEVVHTTSNHLFWAPYPHYGWIPANHLKPGMHLKTPDGQPAIVVGGSVPADHDGWMWDLTVPGNNDHDFYVLAVAANTKSTGGTGTLILVHNANGPECGDQLSLFDEEPYRSTANDGKTRGILEIDGEEIPLTSHGPDPENYIASGHVEGQAALIMREREAASATLWIDNPNGICSYCTAQVPTLLPEGASLDVQAPLGTVPRDPTWSNSRIFIGNTRDPLSPG